MFTKKGFKKSVPGQNLYSQNGLIFSFTVLFPIIILKVTKVTLRGHIETLCGTTFCIVMVSKERGSVRSKAELIREGVKPQVKAGWDERLRKGEGWCSSSQVRIGMHL